MKKSFSRRRYLIYQPPKLKSSMEVDKICCLCFTNESLLKLTGYKWNNANLYEILKYCLPLQDFTDDWHYQSICASCISDLLQTYKFLNKSYTACQIIKRKMSPDYDSDASEQSSKTFHNLNNLTLKREKDEPVSEDEEELEKQISEKYQSLKGKLISEKQDGFKLEKQLDKINTTLRNKREVQGPSKKNLEYDSQESIEEEQVFERKSKIQVHLNDKLEKAYELTMGVKEEKKLHLNGSINEGELVSVNNEQKLNKKQPRIYQNDSDDYEPDEEISEFEENSETSPVKCKFCNLQFNQHEIYLQHLKEEHMNKTLCQDCGALVYNDKIEQHNAQCGLLEFRCEQCKEVFSSANDIREHVKEAHMKVPVKRFTCSICQESFTTKDLLQKHVSTHTNGNKFVCDICGKEFSFKFNLQRHKICHDGIKPFACDKCGKEYTQKTNLKLHQKTCEQKPRQLKCKYCLQPFNDSCALTKHIQAEHKIQHQNIGPHDRVCKICNKEFRCRALLLEHQTIHTGEKHYVCRICQKRFRLNLHLKTHMLTHTEERKHECEICKTKFKQKSHLMYHMSAIHEGDKRWKCMYCGKGFNLKGNLTVHVRIHTGETPYICQVCKNGFIDSNRLKKHLRMTHMGKARE